MQIKDAYRRLCMQHHPDLCPPDQKLVAEKYFKEITEAYTRLSRRTLFTIHYIIYIITWLTKRNRSRVRL